jgi:large subunit ribosomal protein L15e
MSLTLQLRKLWKKPKAALGDLWKSRLISYRKEPVTLRIDGPTRIDRARAVGYKAKKGFFVVRQRVLRGGHRRERSKGKRSKRQGTRLILHKNYQQIAEERANRKYTNCEVLGSYWLAQDGKNYWYEVVLVDRTSPDVLKSKPWVKNSRGRVYRGLTSAGKKSRGLHKKGKGVEKARPSRRSRNRVA